MRTVGPAVQQPSRKRLEVSKPTPLPPMFIHIAVRLSVHLHFSQTLNGATLARLLTYHTLFSLLLSF